MIHKISKYLLTLVAFLTMTTGAWAQTETLLTTIENTGDNASFKSGSKTFDDIATVTFGAEVYNSGDEYGWYSSADDDSHTITVTAANDGYTITRVKFYCHYGSAFDEVAPFEAIVWWGGSNYLTKVNGTHLGYWGVNKIEVYGYQNAAGPEVTTDAANEGDTFTTASFQMPASDVTVTYTLKRDMTVDVNSTIADRIRIKKMEDMGGLYAPVNDEEILPVVTDDLDENNSVTLTDGTHYELTLQKQGEGEDEWTDITSSPWYSVGTFRYKITGKGDYTGDITTATFQLYEGYEVTVPAKEYVTYYKDEALYTETENAKLYTITDVSGTQATATELDVVPANTPLLVQNTAETEQTILLIPTTTTDDVNFYEGFKGTTSETTIPASTASANNYALNGKEFVWVKNAISIAANKAWLEVSNNDAAGARTINIVFGETTGLSEELRVKSEEFATATWYTLDGRKLQGIPTKKGVYIKDGKKVVVK